MYKPYVIIAMQLAEEKKKFFLRHVKSFIYKKNDNEMIIANNYFTQTERHARRHKS
jgi:hypothetical protein